MNKNLEEIYLKLEVMQLDLEDLRNAYKGLGRTHVEALKSLKDLTVQSSEAAKRAAKAAEHSKLAAYSAKVAALDASANPMLLAVVESAVQAAVSAAVAAIESAGASAAASAAAAAAVSQHAEESLLIASAEAAAASRFAADSAAEAVRFSNQARDISALMRKDI
jgi:hypothetical protein